MDHHSDYRFSVFPLLARKRPTQRHWLLLITSLLVVVALLNACGDLTPTPAAPDCTEDSGSFKCSGYSNHTITITNVPGDVTPRMLPISADDEQKLRGADKEGTACIISIAGDLAFYNKNDGTLAKSFKSPITISYDFLDQDKAELEKCRSTLVNEGIVNDPSEVEYLPIYFDKNTIWRVYNPENVKYTESGVTIEITSWGDQPTGWGTKP